jgi:NADH-quinone oxidoreductase subunit H
MDNASLSFFQAYVMPFLLITAHSLAIMIALLLALAFFMYADRKVWAAVQLRRGPNVVGPFGLLQSFCGYSKISV